MQAAQAINDHRQAVFHAALAYAEKGWRVIPGHLAQGGRCSCGVKCGGPGKHPIGKGWQKRATADPAAVTKWWQEKPWANVGMVAGRESGFFVLDVDPRNGGHETLNKWRQLHGDLPLTPKAHTGGGGEHYYFQWEPGFKNDTNIGPGVDVKTDGGFIMAAPSIHPSGRQYEWDIVCGYETPLAKAPEWLLEIIRGAGKKEGPKKKAASSVGHIIPDGQRDDTLASLAGTMRNRGMGYTAILAALTVENEEKCSPPLDQKQVEKIARSYAGYPPGDVRGGRPGAAECFAPQTLRPGDFTDIGQAKVLARVNGNILRFTTATNYLVYDGRVWDENSVKAHGLAQQLTEKQLTEARKELKAAQEVERAALVGDDDDAKRKANLLLRRAKDYISHVLAYRKSTRINATLKEGQPMLAIKVDELDADPFLLNTPGGTVNLKTGEIKRHDPYDLCTKITAASPGTKGAELFADFLGVITCGDKDLQDYLQLVAGMAAIGKVFSELLVIAYGGGRNGKSTYFNLLARVLGNYSGGLSAEFLTINNRQNKKPEFAELRGKRLVIAGELEEGMRLDTAIVKKLCSTDSIRAEKKYKDPFDFVPSHTIVLFTNHLPKVGTSDAGTWRRLVVVPFNAVIEGNADIKNYADYLFNHAGDAVMAWIIEGAARFIQGGYRLDPPACVQDAINEYRHLNDWLNHFLTERCEIAPQHSEKAGNLYSRYREYCAGTGEYTRSAADFKAALLGAGYDARKTKHGTFYYGLRLRLDFHQWSEGGENPQVGRVWAAGKF